MDRYMQHGWKLAHAYVPFQTYTKSYSPEQALKRGTMFPELDMPYVEEKKRGDG
ncbi:spore coat associated protein CotJA [Caldanaerobius polysaccharolyticus]|uniref:spore coat associated protein CotJA n=1 Tax=Caldanaerobius polysaccharolyticus TaxID=44256 RepID=UPI000A05F0F2|nr:spore coat associated protein CotJA [Caldanaerobius polysaccharolyticus]